MNWYVSNKICYSYIQCSIFHSSSIIFTLSIFCVNTSLEFIHLLPAALHPTIKKLHPTRIVVHWNYSTFTAFENVSLHQGSMFCWVFGKPIVPQLDSHFTTGCLKWDPCPDMFLIWSLLIAVSLWFLTPVLLGHSRTRVSFMPFLFHRNKETRDRNRKPGIVTGLFTIYYKRC